MSPRPTPPWLAQAAFTALAAWACNGPPPGDTSPVITATPGAVCEGDDFHTPILLDGTQSTAGLTLVYVPPDATAPPLHFTWTLTGSQYRIVTGTHSSPKLTVTMQADRPLFVDLNVQNDVGGTADSTTTIAVTPPNDAGACPLRDGG